MLFKWVQEWTPQLDVSSNEIVTTPCKLGSFLGYCVEYHFANLSGVDVSNVMQCWLFSMQVCVNLCVNNNSYLQIVMVCTSRLPDSVLQLEQPLDNTRIRKSTHPMNQSTVSRRYSGSRSSLTDSYYCPTKSGAAIAFALSAS